MINKETGTGNVIRHYKDNLYEILNFATHTETQEDVVIYRRLGEDNLWIRPLHMFNELAPTDKTNKTGQKFRFEILYKINKEENV